MIEKNRDLENHVLAPLTASGLNSEQLMIPLNIFYWDLQVGRISAVQFNVPVKLGGGLICEPNYCADNTEWF